MLPFYVLIVTFLLFKILGFIGLAYFESWHTALQGAVAIMLLLTASAHWGKRRPDLIRMVPLAFPKPDWIVTVTGLLEIAAAVGILFPQTSKFTSICLAVLLIAMFPANVRAAKEKLTFGGQPVPKLFLRTVIQFVFLGVVLLAG